MQALAEFPQGIPIPEAEIRSALESVAVPGFTGVIQVEIGLRPEAAQCVFFGVVRRQTKSVNQPATTRQVLPDPERKKPVQKVLDDLRSKLVICTVVKVLELHVADGVLQKITVQE